MKLNDQYPAPVLTAEAQAALDAQLREMHFRDANAHARRVRSAGCRVVRKGIAHQDEMFDRAVRLIEDNDFGERMM